MDESKVKIIQDWPTPRPVKDVQSFLGLADLYRRFNPHDGSLFSSSSQGYVLKLVECLSRRVCTPEESIHDYCSDPASFRSSLASNHRKGRLRLRHRWNLFASHGGWLYSPGVIISSRYTIRSPRYVRRCGSPCKLAG